MIRRFCLSLALAASAFSVHAADVAIDLSGAVTGTYIDGIGADFTQAFDGQSVVGNALVGSPSNPLSLTTSGSITVTFWDPIVAPASNSLLSQPGNAAPLAVLLDGNANSFSWTMGSSEPGSTVTVSLYGANGSLVGSSVVVMGSGYNNYSLSGLPTFRGLTFSDINDPAGVRFQNMSYNMVPEPSTYALMALGLALVASRGLRRREQRA